jgi:hypothetical protein
MPNIPIPTITRWNQFQLLFSTEFLEGEPTAQMNQDLTKEIGKYHAAALDKIGSFYYTEESLMKLTMERDPLFQM